MRWKHEDDDEIEDDSDKQVYSAAGAAAGDVIGYVQELADLLSLMLNSTSCCCCKDCVGIHVVADADDAVVAEGG